MKCYEKHFENHTLFRPTHCGNGNVMDCIMKNEGWKWEGSSGLPDKPLSGDLQSIIHLEEMKSNCTVLHHHGKIKSKNCNDQDEDFVCLKSAQFYQQNQGMWLLSVLNLKKSIM